ncbi:unnamed protein product [Fraxinus pennsylvanica]|uniref:Retrotransposon gag domain-containing protein n=1 Tax=Fraxinus pennsylvanica TaxID=56036 RepID=A0AAD2AAT0_9LAMI|nr:unnamed protein product [Fraxinus pennsylvanica]
MGPVPSWHLSSMFTMRSGKAGRHRYLPPESPNAPIEEDVGTANPADVEEWMRTLESIFDVMDCLEEKKLHLATFLLKGVATDWWLAFRSRYRVANDIILFEKNLKPDIRAMVMGQGHARFSLLVEAASRVEAALQAGQSQGVQLAIQGRTLVDSLKRTEEDFGLVLLILGVSSRNLRVLDLVKDSVVARAPSPS